MSVVPEQPVVMVADQFLNVRRAVLLTTVVPYMPEILACLAVNDPIAYPIL